MYPRKLLKLFIRALQRMNYDILFQNGVHRFLKTTATTITKWRPSTAHSLLDHAARQHTILSPPSSYSSLNLLLVLVAAYYSARERNKEPTIIITEVWPSQMLRHTHTYTVYLSRTQTRTHGFK